LIDGVLVIDKPVGPTSHDVVATARRILRAKRVGHTGTLDPNASGVLPLVLGRATRLAQFLSSDDKEYLATIRFGVVTDSYDGRGRVIEETGAVPSRAAIVSALPRFRGEFEQMPPSYSAKNVDGERAYVLARRAKPVALTAVRVATRALELVSFEPPLAALRIVCSAGFYVRSLAHDLGQAVGTGAILDALVRTRAGTFTSDIALPFGDLAGGVSERVQRAILPIDALLPHWPGVALTREGSWRAVHGLEIRPQDAREGSLPAGSRIRLMSADGALLGVAKPSKLPGFLHPDVVIPPLVKLQRTHHSFRSGGQLK
jgi:tRNA pseudouridine55 synthase